MSATFTYAGWIDPQAVTGAASAVTASSATLTGTVNDGGQGAAGGGNSQYHFDYGTDPTFGTFSSTSATSFSGVGVSASASITGLSSGARYYVRAAATNSRRTNYGGVVSFETTTNVPVLIAPNFSMGGPPPGDVTFSWQYNSGGATGGQTAWALRLTGVVRGQSGTGPWWWSPTGWYGAEVWNTGASSSVTIAASNFTPGETYTWSVATEDASGQGGYA